MNSYFYVNNNIVVKITSLTHLTTSYCNYCHRLFHFVNVDLLRQELRQKFSFTELSRPIKTHDPSRPNYHIPPITKCLPSKKRTTNTVLIDLTNA